MPSKPDHDQFLKVGNLIKVVEDVPSEGMTSTRWFPIQKVLSREIVVNGWYFSRATGHQTRRVGGAVEPWSFLVVDFTFIGDANAI